MSTGVSQSRSRRRAAITAALVVTALAATGAALAAGSFGTDQVGQDTAHGLLLPTNQTITPAGQVFVLPVVAACQSGSEQQCDAWYARQHLRRRITYLPASRYWALQWYETAIFLALAIGLAGLSAGQVRYRRLA